jgi:hypothetical protein
MQFKLKQSYRETLLLPDSGGDEIEKAVNENENIKKQLLEGNVVTFIISVGMTKINNRRYLSLDDFEIEDNQDG